MNYETIVATVGADRLGTITLNRAGRRNAISTRMRREFSDCLACWRGDDRVGAVIVTGAGQAFSAGFDLDEFRAPEGHRELLASSSRYHRDLWNFPKPTIAAVNGPAMGGGFDLACLCDLRIAATTAVFGHPEIKFGAPPLFTPLRFIVGEGHARELCLTGRRFDAVEALRIGLVSAVHDPASLGEEAATLASAILEAPADALRYLKGTFLAAGAKGFEDSFLAEHDRAFEEVLLPKFS